MPWFRMDHNRPMEGSRDNPHKLLVLVKHKESLGGIQC